jgi:flavin reductase (DIM6/NTAB) family NADH-FMN oxidoreductase RutF
MSADHAGRGAAMTDRRRLRTVLSGFATGVTVVTVAGDHPHGMTANSFTSVSLDPPLVLVCVKHDARLHQALGAAGAFGVSVLAADQERIARYFSHADRPRGLAQFAAVDWSPGGETGVPLISDALAWLECTLWQVYEGGDHSIFLGRLVSAVQRTATEPLLFYGGRFRQLDPGGGS